MNDKDQQTDIQVDDLRSKLKVLVSKLGSVKKLDHLVNSDSDTFETKDKEILNQLSEIFDMITSSYRNGPSGDELISSLKTEFPATKFWTLLEKILGNIMETYRDSDFLREKADDQVKLFFREIMDNQIIIYNKVSEVISQLGNNYIEEEIETGVSITEHIISLVIIHRFAYSLFEENVETAFGFNKKICEFLWDLVNRNKEELCQRYILKNLYELKKKNK